MINSHQFVLILLSCFITGIPGGEFEFDPKAYVCNKIRHPLTIDGLPNESVWAKATWSSNFVDIEGSSKPEPAFNTRFKALWDESHLYIFAELEDPHIWATLTEHDQVIYHDNDFEVFIDPDGDTQRYFEIEVNAFTTIFDLFMDKPYRYGGRALTSWDAKGLQVGVDIDGTINDPTDVDSKWSVEMAIPFKSVSFGNHTQTPSNETTWRVNFSRVQWKTEITDNKYHKKIDPETQRTLPEQNWVWSPQGIINMHFPEQWGYLQFSDSMVGTETVSFRLPECESIKRKLWIIYHRQTDFYKENGRYAKSIGELSLEKVDPKAVTLELKQHQFLAIIQCEESKEAWSINQNGHLQKFKTTSNH